ncbi:alpha/beta fold hydrolase, partial [uncultured Corynebacterium sp.]
MIRKKLCVLATATAVSMAPIAVSGTLTATAFAGGGEAAAEAAADKTDVLGRSTMSDKQIADEDGYFDSHDGEGVKIYYRKQLVENPRGNVVLAHGVSEHSGRYDYVAKRLLDAGYNVYRLDHRGHGKSASGSTPLGHIDNFQYILNDFDRVVDMAKGEHPDVKTFLLGHSMGSLTVQAYGIREPGKVDGIITNGGGAPLN